MAYRLNPMKNLGTDEVKYPNAVSIATYWKKEINSWVKKA
jgi:hypothetical protein